VFLRPNRPVSRKHHVSSWAKIVASRRIVSAKARLKFFFIRSTIVHCLALLRNFDGATSNPSEGGGHTFESCRVRHCNQKLLWYLRGSCVFPFWRRNLIRRPSVTGCCSHLHPNLSKIRPCMRRSASSARFYGGPLGRGSRQMSDASPVALKSSFANTRAFSAHNGSYPAAMKKFWHSFDVKQSMRRPMASHRPATERSASLRRSALSFENAFSMGLKSGL